MAKAGGEGKIEKMALYAKQCGKYSNGKIGFHFVSGENPLSA